MNTQPDFATQIFANRCAKNASPVQVADAVSEIWCDIDIALSPIIGQHGVAALIKRSLHLQCSQYPALKSILSSTLISREFPALHTVLIKESSANAIAINNAILNTFYDLLGNLIGATLTRQLLHSVFTSPPND